MLSRYSERLEQVIGIICIDSFTQWTNACIERHKRGYSVREVLGYVFKALFYIAYQRVVYLEHLKSERRIDYSLQSMLLERPLCTYGLGALLGYPV